MIPQYQRLDGEFDSVPLVLIPFSKFSVAVVSLPFFSFIFCVIWSILYYFEQSTSTHCGVDNFLPSISAAIGNYQPQRFVWQFAIVIHAIPRFIVAYIYSKYYYEIIRRSRRGFAYFATTLNVIENFALLGLSLFTSDDHYDIHKLCFGIFIVTSEVYMITSYLLNKNCRREKRTKIDEKSLKYKINLFIINILSIGLAAYFFVRHNKRCEPGVYSMFALFEYIVVFTNMGFHMTAYWDFTNRNVYFDWTNGFYLT